MSTFIYYQLYVFLATLYGGILIGIIYDMYKVFRFYLKPRKITAVIQDLFFWTTITAVAILVLLYSNDGKLRGYTILGFMMGTLLHNIFLSRLFTRMLIDILISIKKVSNYVYIKVTSIFRFMMRILKYPYKKTVGIIKPFFLRIKRICSLPKRMTKDMKKYMAAIIHKK